MTKVIGRLLLALVFAITFAQAAVATDYVMRIEAIARCCPDEALAENLLSLQQQLEVADAKHKKRLESRIEKLTRRVERSKRWILYGVAISKEEDQSPESSHIAEIRLPISENAIASKLNSEDFILVKNPIVKLAGEIDNSGHGRGNTYLLLYNSRIHRTKRPKIWFDVPEKFRHWELPDSKLNPISGLQVSIESTEFKPESRTWSRGIQTAIGSMNAGWRVSPAGFNYMIHILNKGKKDIRLARCWVQLIGDNNEITTEKNIVVTDLAVGEKHIVNVFITGKERKIVKLQIFHLELKTPNTVPSIPTVP